MSKPRNALRFTLVAAMMIAPTLAGQATAHAEPGDSPEARAAALIKPAVVYLEARLNGRVIDEHGTELNGGEPFKILVRCTDLPSRRTDTSELPGTASIRSSRKARSFVSPRRASPDTMGAR